MADTNKLLNSLQSLVIRSIDLITKFQSFGYNCQLKRTDIVTTRYLWVLLVSTDSQWQRVVQFGCFVYWQGEVVVERVFVGIERSREDFDGVAFLLQVHAIQDHVIVSMVVHASCCIFWKYSFFCSIHRLCLSQHGGNMLFTRMIRFVRFNLNASKWKMAIAEIVFGTCDWQQIQMQFTNFASWRFFGGSGSTGFWWFTIG